MLPKADYERDGIRLYHADCMDLLPLIGAGEVAAVISDPPYGISHPCNFAERGRGVLADCKDWSDVVGDDEPFDPRPILSLEVPTVLWGGNHFADRLPPSGGWLVWDKLRPDTLDQATCELAWTNCIKGVRRLAHLWNGMMRASEHGECYHPTQKPVALYLWLMSLPWIPQGTTLDPYMGSGPLQVACIKLGRQCIGIERERKYFDIAVKRVEQAFADEALIRDAPTIHVQTEMFRA